MKLNRKKTSHKGENGVVLAVGGSKEYVGAIALAGISALRAGADLCIVAAPEKVAWAVNALYADLITKKLKGEYLSINHLKELHKLIKKADVILIGSGLGNKSDAFVKKIVKAKKQFVIDADAIKAIRLQDVNNAVITPHAKEFEILLENSNLNKNNFRKKLKNNVILLKGHVDQVISAKKVVKVKGGNPGMTKGGTGDVLAGMCAGFLAQTKDLFKSAVTASKINKKIGDILLKSKKGYYYLASDMAEEIKRIRA